MPQQYRPREPEQTALYEIIQKHYPSFVALTEESGHGLPSFVRREFDGYLDCGILQRGFVRVRCRGCGYERLVAFSCKSRSFCPSCMGRFMHATAAHLADHVIGEVPMRHWVLSLPPPLRYLLAYNNDICTAVLNAFMRSVFSWLKHTAKRALQLQSVSQARPGAVTVVQRASSNLALNVHFHSIVTDGVFVQQDEGAAPVFRALPAPSKAEIAQVAWQTCGRTLTLLKKRGLWLDMDPAEDVLVQQEPILAQCLSASVQGVLTLGPQAGQRVMRLHGEAARDKDAPAKSQTPGYGFNLDASMRVSAHDRKGLERLCRYIARPPLAQSRLSILADGRVSYRLKRPWRDGTSCFVFDPLDFLSKLVALIPFPRTHRIRFHGVFAAHAKLRSRVIPKPPPTQTSSDHRVAHRYATGSARHRYTWATLMTRVFGEDLLRCPKCGGTSMHSFAVVTKPSAIRAILRSVGFSTDSPTLAPARESCQQALFASA